MSKGHVLGPRSGDTTGAALGQGLGLSYLHGECDRAAGPAPAAETPGRTAGLLGWHGMCDKEKGQ